MEAIRQWAFTVCVAAVIIGVLYAFVPRSGGMQKLFNLAATAFFLCCLLSPVLLNFALPEIDLAPAETLAQQNAEQVSNTLNMQAIGLFGTQVQEIVTETVRSLDIKPNSVEVFVNINEDDSIFISEIKIGLAQRYQPREDEVIAAVKTQTGIDPQVYYTADVVAG